MYHLLSPDDFWAYYGGAMLRGVQQALAVAHAQPVAAAQRVVGGQRAGSSEAASCSSGQQQGAGSSEAASCSSGQQQGAGSSDAASCSGRQGRVSLDAVKLSPAQVGAPARRCLHAHARHLPCQSACTPPCVGKTHGSPLCSGPAGCGAAAHTSQHTQVPPRHARGEDAHRHARAAHPTCKGSAAPAAGG
jgi:hypothetical protein